VQFEDLCFFISEAVRWG